MKGGNERMKRNKVGSIFLVSLLALAGVGISYAGFTDSIAIFGTVNTATVELELVPWYSGTWVFKIWGFTEYSTPDFDYDYLNVDEEILIIRGWTHLVATEDDVIAWATVNGGQAELVSCSFAGPGSEHDIGGELETSDIDFTFNNLFPCIDFSADFVVHYIGSIPAKIQGPIIIGTQYPNGPEGTQWLDDLYNYYNVDHPDWGITLTALKAEPILGTDDVIEGFEVTDEVILPGYQLHFCDYIYVEVTIHIPQDNIWQGLYGEFFTKITVIQWNDMCEEIVE
jgi:hypothetical protein